MSEADYFLKIADIEGESTDEKHPKEIEIQSWSFGATQSGSSGSGTGAGAGKVSLQDMHVVAQMSKASALLFLSCASGKHHKTAVLTCRKAGGEKVEYLKITLTDVLVTSYQTGGSGGGGIIPMDQASLNFTSLKTEYTPQDAAGKGGGAITSGWDVKKNAKL